MSMLLCIFILFFFPDKSRRHKVCVIQPVHLVFNSSLPWKYLSSHVHILKFCSLFYSWKIHRHQFAQNFDDYIQSTHSIRSMTPNDYTDFSTKFSYQITCRVFLPQWRNKFITVAGLEIKKNRQVTFWRLTGEI